MSQRQVWRWDACTCSSCSTLTLISIESPQRLVSPLYLVESLSSLTTTTLIPIYTHSSSTCTFLSILFQSTLSLHSILAPSQRGTRAGSSKASLPHPLLLNTLSIGVPTLVLIVATSYGIASLFFFRFEQEAFTNLMGTVQRLALRWTPPTSPQSPPQAIDYITLLEAFVPFHKTSQQFLRHFRGACLAWSIFVAIAVVVSIPYTRPLSSSRSSSHLTFLLFLYGRWD